MMDAHKARALSQINEREILIRLKETVEKFVEKEVAPKVNLAIEEGAYNAYFQYAKSKIKYFPNRFTEVLIEYLEELGYRHVVNEGSDIVKVIIYW